MRHPFFVPTSRSTRRDSLGLCFGDEGFGFKLGGKEREENGFLVEGFDFRCLYLLSSFYQLICLCHMEDEFVADEFGGSVVDVGADQILGPDVPST